MFSGQRSSISLVGSEAREGERERERERERGGKKRGTEAKKS